MSNIEPIQPPSEVGAVERTLPSREIPEGTSTTFSAIFPPPPPPAPATPLTAAHTVEALSVPKDKDLAIKILKSLLVLLLVVAVALLLFMGLIPPELLPLLVLVAVIGRINLVFAHNSQTQPPALSVARTPRISTMPRDTDRFTQRIEGLEMVQLCYTQTERRHQITRQAIQS